MTPSNVLLDAIAARIAADAGTLAPVALENHVHLAKNPFSEAPGLTLADFEEADFDGYAALEVGLGAQQEFVDPTTGQRTIQLIEPAGGWHFETTGLTNLPQTIYGVYVTDNTDAVLYGSFRFAEPVELIASNEAVDVDKLRFSLSNAALS